MTERVDEAEHKCSVCGFIYKDERMAVDCEEFCKTHSACNVKIIEHAIGRDEESTKL